MQQQGIYLINFNVGKRTKSTKSVHCMVVVLSTFSIINAHNDNYYNIAKYT